MSRTLAFFVLLASVACAAPAPRVYLRRVRFEPSHWKRPFTIEPGTAIDEARARDFAEALRRQIVEEGYRDARVEPEIVPTGFRQADLLLKVDEGARYRVQEVVFSGDPGVTPRELRQALRATHVGRVLAWHMHPAFTQSAVDADRARLESFYAARGYFDARVAAGSLQFAGPNASITFAIEAGSRSHARTVEAAGRRIAPGGDLAPREICRCLLDARQQAERSGHADFRARLDIAAAPAGPQGWVTGTARTDPGPVYTVGRIEFRGNHSFSDATLRRAMLLEEGDPFDRDRLRRSLARL
ncbi:MAG TPA: POTRA domain-containing protein, partial [Bryobacterales bacterium]|nr:POTRA domain-containing protein [Bryobacterales bacterium]